MSNSRAHYLLDQLINNSLSEQELNELLATMGRERIPEEYSTLLENYFYELISKQDRAEN